MNENSELLHVGKLILSIGEHKCVLRARCAGARRPRNTLAGSRQARPERQTALAASRAGSPSRSRESARHPSAQVGATQPDSRSAIRERCDGRPFSREGAAHTLAAKRAGAWPGLGYLANQSNGGGRCKCRAGEMHAPGRGQPQSRLVQRCRPAGLLRLAYTHHQPATAEFFNRRPWRPSRRRRRRFAR